MGTEVLRVLTGAGALLLAVMLVNALVKRARSGRTPAVSPLTTVSYLVLVLVIGFVNITDPRAPVTWRTWAIAMAVAIGLVGMARRWQIRYPRRR